MSCIDNTMTSPLQPLSHARHGQTVYVPNGEAWVVLGIVLVCLMCYLQAQPLPMTGLSMLCPACSTFFPLCPTLHRDWDSCSPMGVVCCKCAVQCCGVPHRILSVHQNLCASQCLLLFFDLGCSADFACCCGRPSCPETLFVLHLTC